MTLHTRLRALERVVPPAPAAPVGRACRCPYCGGRAVLEPWGGNLRQRALFWPGAPASAGVGRCLDGCPAPFLNGALWDYFVAESERVPGGDLARVVETLRTFGPGVVDGAPWARCSGGLPA